MKVIKVFTKFTKLSTNDNSEILLVLNLHIQVKLLKLIHELTSAETESYRTRMNSYLVIDTVALKV